jgi:hypothetical protein
MIIRNVICDVVPLAAQVLVAQELAVIRMCYRIYAVKLVHAVYCEPSRQDAHNHLVVSDEPILIFKLPLMLLDKIVQGLHGYLFTISVVDFYKVVVFFLDYLLLLVIRRIYSHPISANVFSVQTRCPLLLWGV